MQQIIMSSPGNQLFLKKQNHRPRGTNSFSGEPTLFPGFQPVATASWEPIERGLEIQEAWKLGNLEVWRLGSLEAGKTGGLEARRPGGVQQSSYGSILGAYRKRFGSPGGLETREPRGLEARRPGG